MQPKNAFSSVTFVGISEYGLPPLRFSTLESKTGWYNKVGILRIRLQGEPARKIRAYAYTAKPSMTHSNANGFYLFDMSTLLDLEIDLHAHMVESKNGKCIPLRTIAARPPRWKAGGVRKGTSVGPKFSSPHVEKRAMIKEAKSFRNKWTAAVKAQRRRLNSLTKGFFTDAASVRNPPRSGQGTVANQ